MSRIVITKVAQRIDNVNADLVTDEDYVKAAEANITLGGAAGDILEVKKGASKVFGDSAGLKHLPGNLNQA